jgi:hypothetical protein
MAIKKSDLYSSLWASCDQLRGGMDASQYKDFVALLTRHWPQWQESRRELNALPLGTETWAE